MSETISYAQDDRLIAIETPLGKDHLLLTSLAGMSHFATVRLSGGNALARSRDHRGESDRPQRQDRIARRTARPVRSTGWSRNFVPGRSLGRDLRQYSAKVVPWLWYLGHTSDCRIFQNLNIPDIIEQVFRTFGFADYQISVSRGDYPKLEFCVQYRETAFNFVSRLMEQAGLFYYFRHDDDRHVMVIADKNVSFHDLSVPVLVYTSGNDPKGQVVSWQHSYTFRPGRWAQTDFDFEIPSKSLLTSETTVLKLATPTRSNASTIPVYMSTRVGCQFDTHTDGGRGGSVSYCEGSGHSLRLDVGAKFTLQDHPCQDPKEAYVISHVHHEASDPTYLGPTAAKPQLRQQF